MQRRRWWHQGKVGHTTSWVRLPAATLATRVVPSGVAASQATAAPPPSRANERACNAAKTVSLRGFTPHFKVWVEYLLELDPSRSWLNWFYWLPPPARSGCAACLRTSEDSDGCCCMRTF